MEKIAHIFDCMETSDFNFDEVGTRFQFDSLVVFYRDKSITIEKFLEIKKNRKVKLSDFK